MPPYQQTSSALTAGQSTLPEGVTPTITAGTANTFDNQNQIPQSSTNPDVQIQNFSLPQTAAEPTISADALSQPSTAVTTPVPAVAPPPDTSTVEAVAERTGQIIKAETAEAQRLKELREQYAGVLEEEDLQSMFEDELGDGMVPQNLQRLQDVQLQLNKLAEQSGLAQVRIAGADGQTIAQAGREVTQEQREAAVRSSALAAEASILEGNIETATSLASQTVALAYQDRSLRNQNMINQINSLQGVVDDQTQQLLTQEARKYQEDQLQVAQAVSSVNSAVASGFASADDVATMTALSGDPQAQKEFADKIVARAARTQMQRALAADAAARNAARASATSETQGQALSAAVGASNALKNLQVIRDNPIGVKAIAGSTSLGRTSFSAGLGSAVKGFLGGTGAGAATGGAVGLAGGPVGVGAGAVVGGTYGGVTGAAGGLGVGMAQASGQRADVAGALGFLVNNATFQELRRLKQQGVTFGSLTEGERVAVGRSADELFSILDVNESGEVVGVKSSEENFYRILGEYEDEQARYMEAQQLIAAGLDDGTAFVQ